MRFLRKFVPIVIAILIIMIFIVALFYAIHMHIDGFGIFSIVAGIAFFSNLLYTMCKNNAGIINGAASMGSNISNLVKIATGHIFLRVMPILLTLVLSYLARRKDKSNKEKAQNLEKDLQDIVDNFKQTSNGKGKSKT